MSSCPIDKCGVSIPSDKLMCRGHWYQCPRELRDELWHDIRIHGWLSREAAASRGECIRAVNQLESQRNQQAREGAT